MKKFHWDYFWQYDGERRQTVIKKLLLNRCDYVVTDGLHLDFSFYFCWSKNPLTLKEFLIRHIFQCSAHVVHRLVTRSWIVKSSRWQGTNWTSHLTQVGKEKGLENHLQSIIASGKLFSMHHLLKTWWSCLIGFLYICTYHVSFVLLLYILSFPYLTKQKIQSKNGH